MGFDMYWDVDQETRYRDCEKSFQLNSGGMRATTIAMLHLDMVFDAGNEPTRAEWNALPEPDWDTDDRGGPEYVAALDVLLARLADEERPGIPLHKLYSTNDGWHVRPIEILGALSQYEKAKHEDPMFVDVVTHGLSWWDRWLDYLARAAKEGNGFRVR